MTFPHRHKLPNGSLRVRRAVPPELIPLIGVSTLTRDLDTKDERIAKARSYAKNGELQAIIDRAREEREASRMVWTRIDPPRRIELNGLDADAAERIKEIIRREFPDAPITERGIFGTRIVYQRADTPPPPRYRAGSNGTRGVTHETLLAEWRKRRSPKKASIRFFEGKLKALFAWLPHNDITRVTDDKLIDYVGYLLDRKKSHTTIKNHLQAIKSIFNFALEIKQIRTNPAALVKFAAKRKKGEGRRDFTPEEILNILTLAREAEPIIRWPNWIAALGGARIEEIARAHCPSSGFLRQRAG